MRNCFVFQCDRRHRDSPKRAMFNTPKDPEKFEQWRKALPNYRPLKPHDRVCEKHFKPTDILRDWTYNIEGKTEKLPRAKPVLQPDAVPCYIEPTDAVKGSKRGRKTLETGTAKLRAAAAKNSVTVVIESSEAEESSGTHEKEQAVLIVLEDVPCEGREETKEEQPVKPNDNVVVLSLEEDEILQRDIIFEELYDNIFEVELPCTLWGVHREPDRKYVAFSRLEWSDTGEMKQTSLVIDCTLKCNARVTGKLMFKQDLAATLIPVPGDTEKTIRYDGLEELLDKLEQATIAGNDKIESFVGNNSASGVK
uniref:THAP-type domain-containing protein n=1 Tax=Anopheles farauti TaxID=69004 RepID=A0A182QT72_9DIPT